jgi:two-component system, OmpR family, phosphate regulon response regulator PhoB
MRETGRPTVSVAHNDEDTRSLLRFWLEAEGYCVTEAADGQEAVELTRGKCPDLILMSERMPKLGGLEAARRVRQKGKECVFPIVAMSAYPTAAARAAAINAGCDSFIPHPVDFNLLGGLLSRLLRGAAGGRRMAAHAGIALSP